MSKIFTHYNETYGFYTYLFIGSKEEMLSELHKAPVYMNKESLLNLVDNMKSSDAGFTVDLVPEEGVRRYLVYIPEFEWIVNDLITVSHECMHVAQLSLLERGIGDLSNDSCFHCLIYLHDSIERAFLNKLKKWKEEEEKKKLTDDNIESVVNHEEESTADVELKKEIEKEEKKAKKKKKK